MRTYTQQLDVMLSVCTKILQCLLLCLPANHLHSIRKRKKVCANVQLSVQDIHIELLLFISYFCMLIMYISKYILLMSDKKNIIKKKL